MELKRFPTELKRFPMEDSELFLVNYHLFPFLFTVMKGRGLNWLVKVSLMSSLKPSLSITLWAHLLAHL